MINKLDLRITFLVLWLLLLVGVIIVILLKGAELRVTATTLISSLTLATSEIVAQLGVIASFLFAVPKSRHDALVKLHPKLGMAALLLTVAYIALFFLFLHTIVVREAFGPKLEDNVSLAVTVMGFLSLLAVPPVGFLFAYETKKDTD